jgi:hypothetical protein
MKNRFFSNLMLYAASASLLAACGGGISLNFGESRDFDEPGNVVNTSALITVTSATLAGQNGVYGGAFFGLSGAEKVLDGGSFACVFSFSNLTNLSRPAGTLSGRISYRENASTLSRLEFNINGAPYAASYQASFAATGAAAGFDDSRVERGAGLVTFSDQLLVSTNALDTSTLIVSGALPMRGNRPPGC